MGSVTPPERAPLEGMMVARTASVAAREYVMPMEVLPNKRTNMRAMRRARPVLRSVREMRKAVRTSQTMGSE